MEKKLPENGTFHPSKEKKFQEVILLIPYFGAHEASMKRHIQFLNDLGYDCATLELHDDWKKIPRHLLSSQGQFGLKHVWSDQIENLLNTLPGKKILFSFSNPSASAIEVIARRQAADIRGLICDGGPSGRLWNSMVNYFKHEKPVPLLPLRASLAMVFTVLWHPRFMSVVQEDLRKFPKNFRVLSIRGWKDPLISPQMIDLIFDSVPGLDWQKLSLPQGAHLNGLKDFREEYEGPVKNFLKQISTPI